MTNEEVLDRFAVEHFLRNSISAKRQRETLFVLNKLAAQVPGLLELTPSAVMAWQGAELARGICPNTLRNHESMVGAFVSWLFAAQLISFELMTQLKFVSPARGTQALVKPKPYTLREVEALKIAIGNRYPLAPTKGQGSFAMRYYLSGRVFGKNGAKHARKHFNFIVQRHAQRLQLEAMVSLALEEGLRSGEILSLTMPRVHYDNAGVLVQTSKGKPGEVREREVPFTNHSRLCIEEWLEFRRLIAPEHDGPWLRLMPDAPDAQFTRSQMEKVLSRLGFRWHRLRHTFATERLRAGLPLEKLQILMGHSNMQQTLAYAQIVNADVRVEAHRTADEFERLIGVAA